MKRLIAFTVWLLFIAAPAIAQSDFLVESTFDLFFTSRRFSTGAPFTLAGSPSVAAYEDNSTTEITAGITLTADFDARTGLNHLRIVATGANGYEAGKSYTLVVTAGTVDSVSVVGEVVGSFTLERSALANDAITAAKIAASAITSSEAPNLDAAVSTRSTQTSVDTIDDFVDTEVADILADTAVIGTPAGASVSADIAAIEAQTDDIGAAGAGLTEAGGTGDQLTAVPWNASWDAEVESEANDALVAIHLDHLLATTYDPAAEPGAADALLNELIENDAGVARYTANALEQAPAGGGGLTLADFFTTDSGETYASAVAGSVVKEIADNAGGSALTEAGIADAVWNEAVADHVGAGSTGERLERLDVIASGGAGGLTNARAVLLDNLDAAVSTRASQTSVDTIDDFVDTEVAAILDDTGTSGVVIANNGITAAKIATDAFTSDELAASFVTEVQAGLATAAALDAVDNFVDTEVADILADTAVIGTPAGASVSADIAAIEAQTDDIGAAGAGLTAIPSGDIPKNQALADFEFLMVDSTDHISPKTGLTVAGTFSCDGAAFGAVAGTIAEVGNGVYQFDAAAGDTNCNIFTWRFTATGADSRYFTFRTRQ